MSKLSILHPIERQVRVAERLAPAERFRARRALLLSCGDGGLESQGRDALRAHYGVDDVRLVVAPVTVFTAPDAGTVAWLRAWLSSELRGEGIEVAAVAAHPDCGHFVTFAEGRFEPAAAPTRESLMQAAERLRTWRLAPRVAALWIGPRCRVSQESR